MPARATYAASPTGLPASCVPTPPAATSDSVAASRCDSRSRRTARVGETGSRDCAPFAWQSEKPCSVSDRGSRWCRGPFAARATAAAEAARVVECSARSTIRPRFLDRIATRLGAALAGGHRTYAGILRHRRHRLRDFPLRRRLDRRASSWLDREVSRNAVANSGCLRPTRRCKT